jgi:uncharacterized membrane protein YbhN (UPF0104 family)
MEPVVPPHPPEADDTTQIVGISLYGGQLLLLICTIVWLFSIRCFHNVGRVLRNITYSSPKVIFLLLILAFLIVRLVWLSLEAFVPEFDNLKIGLNRLGMLLYFSAYSLIICFWAERLRSAGKTDKRKFWSRSLSLWTFIILNIGMYAIQSVFVILAVLNIRKENSNGQLTTADLLSHIDLLVLTITLTFSLIIALLVYGILIGIQSRKAFDSTRKKITYGIKVMSFCLVLTICFVCRAIVFLYRTLARNSLPEPVFYVFAYFLPEIIPTIMLSTLFISATRSHILNTFKFSLWLREGMSEDSPIYRSTTGSKSSRKSTRAEVSIEARPLLPSAVPNNASELHEEQDTYGYSEYNSQSSCHSSGSDAHNDSSLENEEGVIEVNLGDERFCTSVGRDEL